LPLPGSDAALGLGAGGTATHAARLNTGARRARRIKLFIVLLLGQRAAGEQPVASPRHIV
jgi:hypothetical protein